MRPKASVPVALAAALLSVVVVGCGTSPPSPARPTGAPPIPGPSTRPASTSAHVGADCSLIPVHGPGSFTSMRRQRAAAAASSNPQLSAFSSAVRAASLDVALNQMRAFTLFVSTNTAFAALSKASVNFLHNPAHLVTVVRRQVVPAEITPAQIARGGSVPTLSGSRLALAKKGNVYRVNHATVLCGNIKTANGTLYVIDQVLLPQK
jgi:uncharacterized surface protein with fasciclin (FAS1) repeats